METTEDVAVSGTERLVLLGNGRRPNHGAVDNLQGPDSNIVDVTNSDNCSTTIENPVLINNGTTADDSLTQSNETVNGNERITIMENPVDNGTIESAQIQDANSRTKSFRRQFGMSSSTIFMTLLTGVGSRIVIIPIAISNGGLMFGTAGIFILAVISIHCSHLLIGTSDKVNKKRSHSSFLYPETIEEVFLNGPVKLRRYAHCMSHTAHALSYLAEFGYCIEGFLFIAGSLHEIVTNLHGSTSINEKGFIAILLPFVVVFTLITKLRSYAVLSRIINLGAIIAVIITYSYCIPGPYSTSVIPYVAPLHKIPHYFGCIMYIFEASIMLLPMRGAMAYPEDFLGLTGVFATGKMFVYTVYGGLGFFGYLKHGEKTQSSLSFNLPKTTWGEIARIFYASSMFLGISFQVYILTSFSIWPGIRKRFELDDISMRKNKLIENGLGILVIATTAGIALIISDIDLLIGLIGSLGVGPLLFIFPPLLDMIAIWNSDIRKSKLILSYAKDVIIILFGLVACSTGTYVAFRDIINGFSDLSNIKF